MPPEPAGPASWTLRCACGAAIEVRSEAVGKPVVCAACGASVPVVWARDPRTGARVAASAVRVPQGGFEVRCECGQTLVARREHAGKRVKCPACARSMTLEKIRDPQTLETKIRPAKSAAATTSTSKAPTAGQDFLCSCGESLRVTADHLGKQGQCPHCGAVMKLEKGRDPQTQSTELRVRVVGQVEPPPKPKKKGMDDWDLSDFQ